jgi:molybdopterin-guanine dinucleotide biosynthesis protein A
MPNASFNRDDITGLVLAGGRGSRMGGVDKGLQLHLGQPLARHALRRLAPQVGTLMVNANRHLREYSAWGVQVHADVSNAFDGPLAGFLAGLAHCSSSHMVTVPCDTPNFPADLVERLFNQMQVDGTALAMAATCEQGVQQTHPVFCLLQVGLADSLSNYLQSGQRKIERWCQQQDCSIVLFNDADAFYNANTLDELAHLQMLATGDPNLPG